MAQGVGPSTQGPSPQCVPHRASHGRQPHQIDPYSNHPNMATTSYVQSSHRPQRPRPPRAMGDYVFTDMTSGDKVRVEYTFGYKRNDDGKVHLPTTPLSPMGRRVQCGGCGHEVSSRS